MKNTASILLVDDDSAFRHVMAGELRRLGHDVATAGFGRGSHGANGTAGAGDRAAGSAAAGDGWPGDPEGHPRRATRRSK